ncbi:hypothetical protein ACFQD2_05070 [Pseudomonas lini]
MYAGTILASVLAVVFIGTRQHALLILMHEFSHRQFSRTRPMLNDTLGDLLTAIPFTITISGFVATTPPTIGIPQPTAIPTGFHARDRTDSRFQNPRSTLPSCC